MQTETIHYRDGDQELEGFCAFDPAAGPRPAVLVSHAWGGPSDNERAKAQALCELGYVGFALDVYGTGKRGTTPDVNSKLMEPFLEDRSLLERRMLAAVETVRGLDAVDASKVGAIGFCFGGLCVLDLARSGADLAGVVSFHGLLGGREGMPTQDVKAKVLVCHGASDAFVTKEQFDAFTEEMTDAGADWQLHMYGHAVHAFTNPNANDPDFGTVYEPKADRRSWRAMVDFFEEVF